MTIRFGLAPKFMTLAIAALLGAAGCWKSQQDQTGAVREGIRLHLASLNTLNLGAMQMNVTNVRIDGNTAQADVEYVPKTGGAPGAGMQVSYSLEKRGEQWVVVKKSAMGGTIEHPAENANPHVQPGQVHGNLPNFRELLPPAAADSSALPSAPPAATGAPPPGHPPVNSPNQPRKP